jgi:tRNA (adenine22-N1)-methyltransferase
VSLHPLFTLGERLGLCASMVRPNAKLADIGTDHAYLPIWLAKQGLITRGIGADINLAPMQKAQQNIKRYRVQDIVSARLSDGLNAIFPFEADDFVIAGMGGEMISKIITAAPWLKNPQKRLILQPMTSVQPLREFLAAENFAICDEQAVFEDGRVYTVILAQYEPAGVSVGELYPYIGKLNNQTEANREYMRLRVINLEKKARGFSLTRKVEEAAALDRVIQEIRERIETGQCDEFNR